LYVFFRGGDDGVYGTRFPQPNAGWSGHANDDNTHPDDKFEMADLPCVPTYEQATRSADLGDNDANRYNGQTYTLTPKPMPTLEVNSATSPIFHTGFSPQPEKLGTVNGQNVDAAIRRPTHVRASSHGDYVTSPTYATPQNPFSDRNYLQPTDQKRNPFADPVP